MRIEVEDLGSQRRDFWEVRDELIASGQKFSEATLSHIPYSQLHLCCIGNAGAAACSQKLVQQEKQRRRERYLSMEPDEFEAATNYLKIEQMYDDVKYAIAYRHAPKWDSLNDRQKAVAKLRCICNHIDEPQQRLGEAILLLRKCSTTCLPSEVAITYMNKLKGLLTVYPGKLSDETFRAKMVDITSSINDFLPDEERVVLEREELQDFSCTSDCYRVLL